MTSSAEETFALGVRLAGRVRPGDVIALVGELGSGKTTLTKGIAAGLGVRETVRSPSFTIVTDYDCVVRGRKAKLYHIDLYRLPDSQLPSAAAQFDELGLSELLRGEGVAVIEWAERAGGLLPPEALRVELKVSGENRREITVSG